MKIIPMLIGLSCLIFTVNAQSNEINSLPKFEKKLTNCLLMFSSKNKCIAKLLKKHLPEGNDAVKPIADQLEEIFVSWLSTEKVANVYPIEKKELGDFMLLRSYIVEDSSASILLFEIAYRKALGNWYVLKFGSSDKFMGSQHASWG